MSKLFNSDPMKWKKLYKFTHLPKRKEEENNYHLQNEMLYHFRQSLHKPKQINKIWSL